MSHSQSTNRVLMIRPAAFSSNLTTLADNSFQNPALDAESRTIQVKALAEFDRLVKALRGHGVDVRVIEDRVELNLPDSVFPNNWFSTTTKGRLIVYPMRSEVRRKERRPDVIEGLRKEWPDFQDLTLFEKSDQFLEGTGSLVIDHVNSIVYACISQRTSSTLVTKWSELNNFLPVIFKAVDSRKVPVYHTNVVMSIGTSFAVVCLESISDQAERKKVGQSLIDSGRELIEIDLSQMDAFCGNVLEVCSADSKRLVVMSECAFRNFRAPQLAALSRHAQVIHSDISTIEKYGGGSARCMLAELF